MKKDITRRDFIKGTVAASVAIAGSGIVSSCSPYNSKGLATTILGKTGVEVPRIALGLGSRWCSVSDEDKALEIITYALDKGLYYWDTAGSYVDKKNGVVSEERIGKILKDRRKEVFISTKVQERDPDKAMKQIETSLKRLQIDQLDMLKVHSVQGGDKLEEIKGEGKLIEIVHRMKEEGLTKFIGFSGHSEAAALKFMAENYEFDSMLFALNHYNPKSGGERQELAIPAANANGMGVMLMKVVRPIENDNTLDPSDMIRYALSIDGVNGAVIGTDSKEIVDANVAILNNFKSMSKNEMDKLTARLAPFYQHQGTPWMDPGYCDGNWA